MNKFLKQGLTKYVSTYEGLCKTKCYVANLIEPYSPEELIRLLEVLIDNDFIDQDDIAHALIC